MDEKESLRAWALDNRHVVARKRQVGFYTKVWVGFVAFSVALFGIHLRDAGLNSAVGRMPWQGVVISWPLSVAVLYMLKSRAETLPAAVFDRLVSSKEAYVLRCRSRTVLSHNGLATVFKSIVLTSTLSLVMPLAIREPQANLSAIRPRIFKAIAWGACAITTAVSATVLGLIQSQAPIEFTFLQPQNEDSVRFDNDNDDSIYPQLSIEAAEPPISRYISLLKPGSWTLIATTSRRHNVWVRLNSASAPKMEKTLDLTTSLASDHPLFNPRMTLILEPQLSAVYKGST